MYRTRILLFICFWLTLSFQQNAFATSKAPVKPKCRKAENLLGTWYSEYEYAATGTLYMLVFDVTRVSDCSVEGTLHWPDFFNCKSEFSGEVINNTLVIDEHEVIQGYNMEYMSRLEVPLSSFDTLRGSWLDKENKLMASCYMVKGVDLTAIQKDSISSRMKDYANEFGTVTFPSGQQDIDQEAFWKKYKEHNDKTKISTEALEMTGKMNIGMMTAPLYMVYQHPGNMYMEMEFQNLKFLVGSNQQESWQYNPLEDKLEVKEKITGDTEKEFGFDDHDVSAMLKNGYELKKMWNAQMDSISTFRLLLQKEGEEDLVYFIDKRNYQVVRKEQNHEIDYYLKQKKINGYYMPFHYYQIKGGDKINFYFTEVRTKAGVDETFFQVPESLKGKIKKNVTEKDSEYFNNLGVEKHENGNYKEAIEEYSKAIRLNPRILVYYQNRGKARKESGDYYGAISDYNFILEYEPKNAEVINLLGVAKYDLGDYQNAAKDFSQALKYDSTFLQAYTNRAQANFQLGELEMALEDFARVVKMDSTNGEGWYSHGAILVQLEKYDEAVESYTKAINNGFDNADAYNRRGVAYFSQSDFQNSLTDFRKAISLDKTDYIKFQNLGNAYAELGDYKKSNEQYEVALGLAEEKAEIYNRLGLNYYAMEAYGAAKERFNSAINANPKNAQYYDNRAMTRAGLNDFSGAIEDYSTSLSLYPDDPEIHIQRGILYANLHNRHEGCKDFKKALELGHEQAQEMIDEYCNLMVGKE